MDGASTFERWVDIGAREDIPLRGACRVRLGANEIGIFRTARDEILAIDNRCPHRGGPLSEGIVHDDAVTCPLHNWVLDLRTGHARGADSGCVRTHAVEVRGGRIFLRLNTD